MFQIGNYVMPGELKKDATESEKVLHALETRLSIPVPEVKIVKMSQAEWEKMQARYPANPNAEWLTK